MKKSLSVILIMLLVITGTLSGCSTKSSNDNSTEDYVLKYESSNTESTVQSNSNDEEYDISYDSDLQQEATADKVASETGSITSVSQDIAESSKYRYREQNNSGGQGTEEYNEIIEAGFKNTNSNPESTFSIDVDTASYANLRKNLNYGIIPVADAVRIEEMLNYFDYEYEEPTKDELFSINTEIGKCPWNDEHYLLTVGLKGKSVNKELLPKSNLVFLIDVSGSMDEPDKLPLLKYAFSKLVEILGENDRVSLVVYAGDTGIVLDSVPGSEKDILLTAIEELRPGGSTQGAAGIELAYKLAEKNYKKGGNNRIILATDGDFNVGPSSVEELESIITEKRESGIFLSVIGFGSGNLKDNRMETLADKGNGNYSYIDSTKEAKKVLVDEMAGTLLTIAKDVKIQVEFNPYNVAGYRLIGYENRALADEDFDDDTVDAGELGAGHKVTAVYEIIPTASSKTVDKDLKYQSQETVLNSEFNSEISEIRLRYKEIDKNESKEIKQVVSFGNTPVSGKKQSEDFYFIAAIIEFGMLLRDSYDKGTSSLESIMELARKGLGEDENGYRLEFMNLVDRYEELLGFSW